MSTPTGRPGNPTDPFVHGSQDTYERADPGHHAVESDGDPTRSPYAPTRARERASAERSLEENSHESVVSPYAPKKARTAVDAKESYPLWHELDLDASLQPAHPHGERPATTRRDAGVADLKRLEATLRWIQREEAATRIPRAAQLPPVSGLAAAEHRGRRHGEMLDFPPRSLEPERMAPPPPMISRRHSLRAALVILTASVFAAPIGYYFSTGGWNPSSQPAPGPEMASAGPKTDALPSSVGQQELPRTMSRIDRGISAQGEISPPRPETSQPGRSSESETVAMLQPSATGDQASPASKSVRMLDPEEIKLLMKQGERLIAAGDVVTARTVFQRAAEAGDADAAMALGATYDPHVLAKLGVVGVSADVEQARSWYQRAETLGSRDARQWLDLLANR
jgi:hypothetical protein